MTLAGTLARVACMLACIGSVPAMADGYFTEQFASGEKRPVTAAVLRADAEIFKTQMAGAFLVLGLSDELAVMLDTEVQRVFESKGYDTRFIDAAALNADPLLQGAARGLSVSFGTMSAPLTTRPKDTRKHRFTFGDDARLLAARLEADAVVLPVIGIAAKAPGAMAASWLLTLAAPGYLLQDVRGTLITLFVCVIDGASGDLQAVFELPRLRRGDFSGYEAIMADPTGKLRPLVERAMEDLPPADPSLRTAETAQDVIGKIEALLTR